MQFSNPGSQYSGLQPGIPTFVGNPQPPGSPGSMLPFFLSFAIGIFLAWILRENYKHSNGPPGPWVFPVVGYLPFMTATGHLYRDLIVLSRKYGEIYQVQLGLITYVVLNSADAIKEALDMGVFSDRPRTLLAKLMTKTGYPNLSFSSGYRAKWSQTCMMKALRSYLLENKQQNDDILRKALLWMHKELSRARKKSVATKSVIDKCYASVSAARYFGTHPHPDEDLIKDLLEKQAAFQVAYNKCQPLEYLPFLEPKYTEQKEEMQHALEEIATLVMEHLQARTSEDKCMLYDHLGVAYDEIAGKADIQLTKDEVKSLVLDLYDSSNSDTVTNIEWILLILASSEEVQGKLKDEIKRVIGTKEISAKYFPDMPYAKSVLHECLRFASSTALGLYHTCRTDTEFRGWTILKGSYIIPILWTINHDPEEFDDPDAFNPDRFLDDDGLFNEEKASKIAVFSVGKRKCVGEELAKIDLTFFMLSIVRDFKMSRDESFEGNVDPLEGIAPYAIVPGKHKIFFENIS